MQFKMKHLFSLFLLSIFLVGCETTTSATGTKRPVFFDKIIEDDQVEIELYNLLSNAKKRVYLKNFPALNTKHSKDNPDLFIDLLSKLKRKGVDIKLIHIAKRGLYPLTKHLYLNGIKSIEQHDESYNYGVVGDKAKYAIIDDIVFVLYDPDDFPRIIGLEVEKQDLKEDFLYTWEYIIKTKNRGRFLK
jgi:hypothetical protein